MDVRVALSHVLRLNLGHLLAEPRIVGDEVVVTNGFDQGLPAHWCGRKRD